MNKKRVILLCTVIGIVVLIGILIGVFAPSLMQAINDMHRNIR